MSQGKVLSEKKTIEESNIKEGATLEMTMRLQFGTKDREMMTSAGTMDERQVKRRASEPCSEISGIDDVKVSEVTDHIKREIDSATKMMQKEISSASKRSDETIQKMVLSFQSNTMERMETMVRQSNEMMLQQVSIQLRGMNTTIEKMKEDGEDKYDNKRKDHHHGKTAAHAGRSK